MLQVLILVLMEDTLRVIGCAGSAIVSKVLILVLMEDTLRVLHLLLLLIFIS